MYRSIPPNPNTKEVINMIATKNEDNPERRELTVSGKIPRSLFDAAKSMIDGGRYRTMNDVVETALRRLVTDEQNRRVGGDKIGV